MLQKATFANWVNERLKSDSKIKVTDLVDDLQDGTVLIRLVETLTSKKIKGFNKPVGPALAAHKLANLELAFKSMQNSGVKLVGIGKICAHFFSIAIVKEVKLVGTGIRLEFIFFKVVSGVATFRQSCI